MNIVKSAGNNLGLFGIIKATKANMSRLGGFCPSCKPNLLTILLLKQLTWTPKMHKIQEQANAIGEDVDLEFLHRHIQHLWCLHRLLAIDDDLEHGVKNEEALAEHLCCCFLSILLGYIGNQADVINSLRQKLTQISTYLGHDNRKGPFELKFLLQVEQIFSSLSLRRYYSSTDYFGFLLHRRESPTSKLDRSRLCSSYLIGVHYSKIYSYLQSFKILGREALWHDGFFWSSFLDAAYGQILSLRQKSHLNISLELYLDLAVSKSNSYMDLVYSYRFLTRRYAFYNNYMNEARYCEQIYLDDLFDLAEDTKVGTLNYFHIFLIEQGRLSDMLQRRYNSYVPDKPQKYEYDHSSLEMSPLNHERYRGVFIHRNSYVPLNCGCARLGFRCQDCTETLLRKTLINAKSERFMPLAELVQRRALQARTFKEKWIRGDRGATRRILLEAHVVERCLAGFREFLRENQQINGELERGAHMIAGLIGVLHVKAWAERRLWVQSVPNRKIVEENES